MYKNKLVTSLLIILTSGIVVGCITSFGQTYLPDPFKQLANSYSVWLLFSFLMGSVLSNTRLALLGGVFIQYIAIIFYYITSNIRFNYEFNAFDIITLNIPWIVGGTLMGPVCGYLGYVFKHNFNNTNHQLYAISVLVGLFISESTYNFFNLKYFGEGVVFLCMGLIIFIKMYFFDKTNLYKKIVYSIFFGTIFYISFVYGIRFILGG